MIGLAIIAQLTVLAHGPDTATSCQPFTITAAVRSVGGVAPRLELGPQRGLQLLRRTAVQREEDDGHGGRATVSEATFLVATREVGRRPLPSVTATAGTVRAVASSGAVMVTGAGEVQPQVLVRSRLDAGGDATGERAAFVGQQVDYVVDVFLNQAAREHMRRSPTFFPPDMPSVLAYDLAPAAPTGTSECFETLTYRRALFPLFPGPVTIPPATLTYSLPLSSSFFAREENHEVHTEPVQLTAVEPPASGRPAGYAGAVGAVALTASLAAPSGRMGDPIVLTVRLRGVGNVKLLPRPTIEVPWASVALGDERVTVDTSSALVRGAKEFEWLLTPRQGGRLTVPGIRYPFFDPARAAYDVALAPEIPLDVAHATLASADTLPSVRLSIRTVARAEQPPALPSRPWFWAFLLLAPGPAAVVAASQRTRRGRATSPPARRLRALVTRAEPASPRLVRRLFMDSLHARVPALGRLTPGESRSRTLRRAGVTDATADATTSLLERLDAAAFSSAARISQEELRMSANLAEAVDAEAIPSSAAAPVTWRVIVPLLLATAAASAIASSAPAWTRSFDAGVRAYSAGEYEHAARLFGRATDLAPRSVDAWANVGTASLAATDTAGAVLGWQRALRLDPLDAESRERLQSIVTPAIGSPGFVPPLPVNPVALAGAACWILFWFLLAIPSRRRPRALRFVGSTALLISVSLLASALAQHRHLNSRDVGIVRRAGALREDPSPDAPLAGQAATGDVVSLGRREGRWVRVTGSGARAAWMPTAAILPLAREAD